MALVQDTLVELTPTVGEATSGPTYIRTRVKTFAPFMQLGQFLCCVEDILYKVNLDAHDTFFDYTLSRTKVFSQIHDQIICNCA